MKTIFTVLGLMLILVGSSILLLGGFMSYFARIETSRLKDKGPWYQKIILWMAVHFGSNDQIEKLRKPLASDMGIGVALYS